MEKNCGAWEMNNHQPEQRPVFGQRRWGCVYVGLEESLLLWGSGQQTINSDKYCSQLDQLKALEKKCLE